MLAKLVYEGDSITIDMDQLCKVLHVKVEGPHFAKVQELALAARKIAAVKAVYKLAFVEAKGESFVTIDGITFTSRVLSINLADTYRVFPYVITCGTELSDWAKSQQDMLDKYYADIITEMILKNTRQTFFKQLDEHWGLESTANMNPGSLADWPITEQIPLFNLIGNVENMIGVRLTESCLMVPIKSVSGIHFPKQGSWENCQLCPREGCPGRKAPYDEQLFEEKFKL
ncbi:vitamin B12 dependent-methionine synthase activation domain-containing protein [Sporomusa malonica]|uniref:Vitamin B12 dependent methionine synthase, activation domain n=1 Tax=Sporomusa malonica TaxID=112901 RepID=A0A1W1ZCX2_9FIRM|nr:vitamin B12 dependent-methionine synthase activation domain-containing protein [Sporomusa malonica]SMC46290.1 Vitamin B12 dependent methionine synthase, activation domain [Sporomusa malonica]